MKNNFIQISRLFFYAVALVFVFGGFSFVQAQTVSGTMQGRVTDPNGDAVPGATVNIKNVETGQLRTLTTNDEGFYNAPFLPIGRYEVDATGQGFNKIVKQNVEITLNNTTVSNFALAPSVSGEVTITADPPLINSTNQQVSSSLSQTQVQDIPVANQSNFLSLAEVFPGFQQNPDSSTNNPTLSVGSSVNFNGTGTRGATFQINGVNNDDSSENQNRQGVSLATIKEFQIISNSYTAEFGRSYGAVVLVQTLSGTNKFRGSAYVFHNNSSLNAKRFFDHGSKPVNRRNQYGFTLGFPILKDRLFGFVSFDQTKNSGDQTITRDIFYPSEYDEANWFNKVPANRTPENIAFIRSVLARFPQGAVPNDPANRGPRAYVANQPFNFPNEDYSGRFDWNATKADTVFARYQYTRQQTMFEEVIVGEQARQNNKQQNLGVTWTHVFSPQLVGEFRYGVGLRTTLANIQAGNDTPIIRFNFNPDRAVAGTIIGNAGAFPIQRYQTDHQFVYNLSWVLGSNHFLKMGTDIRAQRLDDLADNFSRGFYQFNTSACGGRTTGFFASGYESFLNGCVGNYQRGYGNFYLENRLGEANFYGEDNWKIRPNLTLNLGLRYEYVKAPRELNDKIEYGYGDDTDNIEPRIGFAYSPNFEKGILRTIFGESGKSSIRGGYGVYHGRVFQSVFAQGGASIRTNPPLATFRALSGAPSTIFDPNNLSDPTRGYVFVPGPDPTTGRLTRNLLVDPNLEMPYTKQWNFTLERQLFWNSAIRVTYAGNRGYNLLRYAFGNSPRIDPNGVLVTDHPNNAPEILYTAAQRTSGDPRGFDVRGQLLQRAADFQCAGTGLPGIGTTSVCPVAVPLGNLEYSLRVPRFTERRLNPLYLGYTEVSNSARTWYDGLQIEVVKRLSNGINFQASYTWSKALDTTSEATSFGAGDSNQTGNDQRSARALSRFHTPHRFTFYGTFRNPFFDKDKGILGQILGGWQISPVFRWAHGTPFTVTFSGVDLTGDNFSESRPVILDPSILGRTIGNPATSRDRLPVSAFRATTFADLDCCIVGRNTFYIDGLKTVDLALSKKFLMPIEGHSLTVRADFFNAFNWVQFGFPGTSWSPNSASFGLINSLAGNYAPRNIQISLKYMF